MEHTYFAVRSIRDNREIFSNIFRNLLGSKMCIGPNELRSIYEVALREIEPGETPTHWGWKDANRDGYSMIWPNRLQLQVCFPYGIEAATEAGQGREVHLILTPIRQVYPNG